MKIAELLAGKWEKYPEPILSPGSKGEWDGTLAGCPHVWKEKDSRYIMSFTGQNYKSANWAVGIAKSKDLYKWERFLETPILLTGDRGEWDERSALIVSIMRLEDSWCAFYEGEDNKNNYRIGIAYSYDFKKWEKYKGNPIIDIGSHNSFDARLVCSPHIFLDNGKPYLFFSAHDKNMRGSCGVARFEEGRK